MNEAEGQALFRIVRHVDRFEDAWARGQPIPLGEFVHAAAQEDRPELLRQALAVELYYRRARGESPVPEEYLALFPDDAELIRRAFDETTVSYTPARQSAAGWPGSRSTEPSGDADAAEGPDKVGKFIVVSRLGTGGQGSALLARDPDVGRLVVLKRYHGSGRNDAAGALQDGKALARLRSRYTPHCYGLERHGDELVLVMEYIPGRTLSELRGPRLMDPGVATRLVAQVAEGLEAVHACGLIHRDIKPANVVVGDDGVPRLVDFGLAAHFGSTALQGISGTPQYMAPEQARDQWERIDGRTDVYGLGAVLYTLLTGDPPHPGAAREDALEHARLGGVVPPRALRRSIPNALERIVMKALAADSARRYSSAAEFRQALRSYGIRRTRRRIAAGAVVVAIFALLIAVPSLTRRAFGPGWAWGRHASDPIKVTSFEVERFLDSSDGVRTYGLLGQRSFEAAEGDLVRVKATLSEPAFCFLVALNTDGKVQLCYPPGPKGSPDENVAPPATDRIEYPARRVTYFALSDGPGQQGFVLFASRAPLPPYSAWSSRLAGAWSLEGRPSVGVWGFDNGDVLPIRPTTAGARGTEVDRAPARLVELNSQLNANTDGMSFRGLVFPVR
jgi:hypothetical protein